MKQIFKSALALTIILSFVVSCSKSGLENQTILGDNQEQEAPKTGKTITITATLADAMTRVAFVPTIEGGKTTGLEITWAEGDRIRVYNHDDRAQYEDFTLDADAVGQKVGKFTGTALEASSYDVEVINGNFDYASQTQPADGVTSGLKYFASASELSASDLQEIEFTDFSSVLAITAKMPSVEVANAIKSIDIIASEDIFDSGNELTITLETVGSDDDILNLFATLPAGNTLVPDGTTIIVHFNAPGTSHTVYSRYVELGSGLTFSANKCNTINVNATHSDKYAGKNDNGTAEAPYLIADKYQMDAVHELLIANETVYFLMVDDVDMTGIIWQPLNNVADANNHFSKYISFDGDNHTLSNISTNATTIPAYPSVFGVLNGKVANLNIDHATITPGENKAGVLAGYIGSSDSEVTPEVSYVSITNSTVGTEANRGTNYLGGVAAQIQKDGTKLSHVTIESSAVYGNLSENKTIGGIIAYIKCGATLEDCHSSALVHGRAYVGGIVGFTEEPAETTTLISRCYADGAPITATYRYAGGIVGHANGAGTLTIQDCYTTSKVTAANGWAGGISGDHYVGVTQIYNCYSTAEVSANFGAGGIVGQVNADGLDVQKCAVFNAAIIATATDNNEHYSSGAVVAYAKGKKMTVNLTYHKVGISFTECPGNSGNTLPTSNSGISWLNNQTVAQGAHQYIYPYHGRRTTMTLVDLTRDTYSWDANVWDFSGELPTLK